MPIAKSLLKQDDECVHKPVWENLTQNDENIAKIFESERNQKACK